MMGGAKKRVPKRRFKEFLNAGEWKERKLSELATMNARIGWQNLRTSEFLDSGDYLLITGTDFDNGRVKYSTCHYVEKKRFDQDTKIQLSTGSILITKDGTLGKVALVEGLPKPATLNAGVFNVRVKDDTVLSYKYLYHYLKAPFLMKYVTANATGGTIKHLNQSILVDFPIPITEKPEQDRITKLLDSLESSITLHQRKLDKLQATKKALLQEMFPEEGQNKPKRRFKGFTDAWKQRKLGDFTNQINTFVNPEDAKLPLWSLTAEAGLIEKSDRYERDFLVKKKDQFKRIETNTLVYNPMNITIGSIDIYTGLYPIAVSGYYVSIVYDKNIDTDFLKEVLLLPSSLKMYKNYATGSLIERQRVQYPTFSKLQLLLPNLDEQKAIGQLFKSLNLNITLHQRKLDKLKNLKQAYLNEMFV